MSEVHKGNNCSFSINSIEQFNDVFAAGKQNRNISCFLIFPRHYIAISLPSYRDDASISANHDNFTLRFRKQLRSGLECQKADVYRTSSTSAKRHGHKNLINKTKTDIVTSETMHPAFVTIGWGHPPAPRQLVSAKARQDMSENYNMCRK